MHNVAFLNPWKDVDTNDPKAFHRISSNIPHEAYESLMRVCPLHGMIQTTINMLLSSVVQELNERKLTDYDPHTYMSIISARCAYTRPTHPSDSNDDAGRPPRIRRSPSRKQSATHPPTTTGGGSSSNNQANT